MINMEVLGTMRFRLYVCISKTRVRTAGFLIQIGTQDLPKR